ncbi:hypothetical protein Dda_2823 [Drechslerella dactyloides]|uniref:Methyltransferase domain-containing protein n=1 Tax=Drechslerella dactyloides TaxID=74499 RepID=A0AAD6J4K2_DREDA|nr:hypothetical protein Dda_2823 [Drechslerella dactyloides]
MTDNTDKTYIHGHHPSVLTSHSWRTLQNSASYLIPHLEPYKSSTSTPLAILDAGCGPGTITCDLASRLPHAQVTGIDYVLQSTCTPLAASRNLTNVTFQQADIFALPFSDASFDIIHLHQVLQHLPAPPTAAIAELVRVCKPGGIIAVREADFSVFSWFPANEGLDKWQATYMATARAAGGDPLAGKKLHRWFMDADIPRRDISCSSSCWTYSTPEERQWWGNMWAERTLKSNFREQATKHGVTEAELVSIAAAWTDWAAQEDGWIMIPSGEVVVKVNK